MADSKMKAHGVQGSGENLDMAKFQKRVEKKTAQCGHELVEYDIKRIWKFKIPHF